MTIAPIDPSMVLGPQAAIAAPAAPAPDGRGFGDLLSRAIGGLERTQAEASEGAMALATGTATDVESVVMAAERAKLSMQLASTLRTRGVEALNELLRTQV
ncbi:flagellar hook-basal body complex protein FliE [Patulibacter defluvii]|uniref:flagellar hook-basal body complex protein FliE n=1 Tax=Patulibacter defluvii TaxID=3095358 RepID=UPI002A74C5D5|nr:flagellar hook-basal body complex protein FliE [Patulibacter sp. DM4]